MRYVVLGTALLALSFVACGDDDDDGGSDNGGTGNNVAGSPSGEGGEAPSAGGSNGSGNVECDPEGEGVCQNATDCPQVESGNARMVAQTCGLGCLDSDDENCARDCIVEDAEITQECAVCYADTVACTAENCLATCAADPASAGCAECQVQSGCRSAFSECSGLPE
jgi:hypothetical protein